MKRDRIEILRRNLIILSEFSKSYNVIVNTALYD